MIKKIIRYLIERKVRKYFKKHKPLIVFVTGSVGKTTTVQAIATVLSEKYRVRAHEGGRDVQFSVPAAIMGVEYPENPQSIYQWRTAIQAMGLRIKQEKDVDVIVQEINADTPGVMARFSRYLTPDIAVVTAVSEEHMEAFGDLAAVATEELSVAHFSKLTIVNRDDVDVRYANLADTHTIDTYGLSEKAEYRLVVRDADPLEGRIGQLVCPEWGEVPLTLQLIGDHSLKAAVAAACVGAKIGLTSEQVAVGVSKIKPMPGRMQVLRGLNETTLIDDTYSASPLTVTAALRTLYKTEAPMRIAILGSMNELYGGSPQAHEEVGAFCDPTKLDWVVTIGEEAAEFLAPMAMKKRCQVEEFSSPYEAGAFVHRVMTPGAVILATGSEDGVFAEEALKILLHSTEEEQRLVRQSEAWLDIKQGQFAKVIAED